MNNKLLCTCIWWFTVTITCSPLSQNRIIRENPNEKMYQNQDMVNYLLVVSRNKKITIYNFFSLYKLIDSIYAKIWIFGSRWSPSINCQR